MTIRLIPAGSAGAPHGGVLVETGTSVVSRHMLSVRAGQDVSDAMSSVIRKHQADFDAALQPFGLTTDDLEQADWHRIVRPEEIIAAVRAGSSGPRELTPEDFTFIEGGTTFPFIETEDGGCIGYGHQDKAVFVKALWVRHAQADPESHFEPPLLQSRVQHAWARVDWIGDEWSVRVNPPMRDGEQTAIPVTIFQGEV